MPPSPHGQANRVRRRNKAAARIDSDWGRARCSGATMKIRYSMGYALAILIASAFVLGTSLLTGVSINTLTGVLLLAISIGFMVRPMAELTETELTLFALVGPVKKHYPAAQLRLVDGRLYSGDKKVRLPVWAANRDDWRAVLQKLQARGPAT